jgi:glycosyltransferase involved in cell wall biosynthesis
VSESQLTLSDVPRTALEESVRLVFWGTYDLGKPRVRLLLAGARRAGFQVLECHQHVWRGVEDKSQLQGVARRFGLMTRWLLAYPVLLRRYIHLPAHDVVVVGYPGVLDVLALWPVARLRGTPIVWDVFMSLYDTVVRDRRLVPWWSPPGWVLYCLEWLALRAATRPFLDTNSHARYIARLFHLAPERVDTVPVGSEPEAFREKSHDHQAGEPQDDATFTVLFYGQFIPLHGLDVVVEAAAMVTRETQGVQWVLIGRGQEARRIDARLSGLNLSSVTRIDWVAYDELADWIRKAGVCLGIFGVSEKSRNVIPNKVYQALAMGRRVVTSDTPAQRELLALGAAPWLTLVPPGNARALADAILRLRQEKAPAGAATVVVGADEVGGRLREVVHHVLPGSAS